MPWTLLAPVFGVLSGIVVLGEPMTPAMVDRRRLDAGRGGGDRDPQGAQAEPEPVGDVMPLSTPTSHPTTAPGPKGCPSISCWSTTPACRPAPRRWSACAMRKPRSAPITSWRRTARSSPWCAEDRRAWHAGAGYWQGERDINSRSVGVELVNPGHEWGYRPFPDAQMAAFAALARGDHGTAWDFAPPRARPLRRGSGAQGRPWGTVRLARAGGAGNRILADPRRPGRRTGPCRGGGAGPAGAQFGYEVEPTGVLNPQTRVAATAFQRHFIPERVAYGLDAVFMRVLRAAVRQSYRFESVVS